MLVQLAVVVLEVHLEPLALMLADQPPLELLPKREDILNLVVMVVLDQLVAMELLEVILELHNHQAVVPVKVVVVVVPTVRRKETNIKVSHTHSPTHIHTISIQLFLIID
ncbi:hypothetical protein CVS40_12086 [Lucilia cuprina]|nr:hypothetical protein CVS40_12086 [Lucilia cuprina]